HYSRFLTDNPVNEEARRRTELAMQGHPQGSYELEAFDKDGGVHLLEVTEVPVFDDRGRVIGVEGIGQDVTARKRGDRALRESEEQFRTLVANIPGVVFRSEVGPPWRIEYVSDGVEALTGYPVRDFMDGTRTYGSVIVPGDLAEVERLVDEAVAERRPYRIEYQVRRADGEVRWVAERGRAIYDDAGKPLWLDGVILDTTDRRQAEEALRSERDFTARLIDSSNDGILAFDRECRYTLWNAGMERISGLGKEDVLGRVAFELFPFLTDTGEDWFFHEALAGRAARGKDRPYLIPQTGREGYFEGHYGPLFDQSGQVVGGLAVIRDSTQRIRADQERRKLEAQVQQTQKLESLGVLAGGIAHDFNNLLVAILGNADLALGDLSDVSPARASVLEIKKASMRAADLAHQMLAYSGRGRFVVTAVNLNELVEEMGGLLKVSISKKITLNYTLAGDLPPVEADAAQIRQVVMNLITNASEAIGDEPGIISIRTGVTDADRDYLAEAQLGQSLPAGRYVYLQVTDTGCGIDPQNLPKLFEPFYTTKFTGRGLGLAAVLGIVRGHHGAIKVESQVGEGTSFRLLLSRAAEAPAQAPAAAAPAPARAPRGRGAILVVDDERTVRELARKALQREGFTVLTAADGREGVAVFGEHADEISAVLLDMTMPEISGEEAFDALRRICPDVPILLASGYAEEDVTGRFEGRDLAGFIHKPFELRELIAKVRRVTEP
ncbi:MAG: PAS domain-containing hybrid sensor histidine kinase/response regulator, partial [Planctomycetota bacterium]